MNHNQPRTSPHEGVVPAARAKSHTPILNAAAVCLTLTSVLKLSLFFRLPVIGSPADTVLPFLSQRELLLLAAISELVVAVLVSQVAGKWQSSLWLLYFSSCATLYQCGLLFNIHQQPCRCLGVAEQWLGTKYAGTLSRVILAFLWIAALVEWRRSSRKRRDPSFRPHTLLLMLILVSFAYCGYRVKADSFSLIGEYKVADTPTKQGENPVVRQMTVFRVVVDQESILIEYNPATLYPSSDLLAKHGVILAGSRFYATDAHVVWVLNLDSPDIGAVYDSPERVWGLGNTGDGLVTRALVTLRCQKMFPMLASKGRRPLSASFTFPGEPLSVVTEADYEWKTNSNAIELSYQVRISEAYAQQWRESPLLNTSLFAGNPAQQVASGQSLIDRYPKGFVLERTRFSAFTNIGTLLVPLQADFSRFARGATNVDADGHTPVLKTVSTLSLKVAGNVSERPIDLLPVTKARSVTITEKRLQNRELEIGGVTYTTNSMSSFAIAPMAISLFDQECTRVRHEKAMRRIREGVGLALVVFVLLAPIVTWLVKRQRRGIVIQCE